MPFSQCIRFKLTNVWNKLACNLFYFSSIQPEQYFWWKANTSVNSTVWQCLPSNACPHSILSAITRCALIHIKIVSHQLLMDTELLNAVWNGVLWCFQHQYNRICWHNISLLYRDGQILYADKLVPWTAVQGWESSHVEHLWRQLEDQIDDTV